MSENLTTFTGSVETLDALRFTPAGIPVLSLEVKHRSSQEEAGHERLIELILPVIAIGDIAKQMEALPLGARIEVQGFLAHRSLKNKSVVLHATHCTQKLES